VRPRPVGLAKPWPAWVSPLAKPKTGVGLARTTTGVVLARPTASVGLLGLLARVFLVLYFILIWCVCAHFYFLHFS
jgi:hypothetical protein